MFKKLVFKILILICAITLVFLSAKYLISTSFKSKTHNIVLTQAGFLPKEIEISAGDSIDFKTELNEPFWPASDLHPTHGIYPEFDPQEPIDPNKSWIFKFDKIGRWKFHDHLNPFFRGTIIVK